MLAQPVFVRSFSSCLSPFIITHWCYEAASSPIAYISRSLSLSLSVCVCQDIRLPSSSPTACISEAICLCFIFLHDLLSSSLNPAKVLSSTNPAKDKAPLVISLPISLAFYVLLLKSEHKSHIIHYLVSLRCTGCTGRGANEVESASALAGSTRPLLMCCWWSYPHSHGADLIPMAQAHLQA